MITKEKINKLKPKLPHPVIYKIIGAALSISARGAGAKYYYDFDECQVRGRQVILLSDHAATDTYKYAIGGYRKYGRLNPVVGKHHFYIKWLGGALRMIGAIPKNLFEGDVRSVKMMLGVIKMGGSLALFPEGVQSSSGSMHPIHPTTAGFLKRARLTVVLCKSYGSYLRFPRFDETARKGHHEYHYEILFTPDELKSMTKEEIDSRLVDRMKYNDFQWNLDKKYKYESKNGLAHNIDNILYICPKCGSEFTLSSNGDIISCEKCGNRIRVTDTYEIIPADNMSIQPYRHIDDWYRSQRAKVKEEIKAPDYSVSYRCRVEQLHTDKPVNPRNYIAGEGYIRIDHKEILYNGTLEGQEVELHFDIKNVPCYVNVPGRGNEFFYNGEFYMFDPVEDPRRSTKYMMIVEELNKLVDEKWREAYKASLE